MRKPRLSEKTIKTLFCEGKAYSGKYEYETTQRWDDELNTYVEILTRWDENNECEEWIIPKEGIYAFEK